MKPRRINRPYQLMLLAGIVAGICLIALAAILLAQLVIFPLGSAGGTGLDFLDPAIVETVIFTAYQAALSTFFSILIGAILAWSLANNPNFPFRNLLVALISSALVLPTLVVVLGIVSVYGRNGWLADISFLLFSQKLPFSIYGLNGILLAHVFFNASFACRILLHRFESIAEEKHKQCFALGIGFWRRLRIVELPAITTTLPGLATTIFLLCFTSFAIVLTLGGSPEFNTLEVAIYESVRFDFDLPRAFQLAIIQIIICTVLVLIASAKVVSSTAVSVNRTKRYRYLYSAREIIFQRGAIALFAVFFITPLIAVLMDGTGSQLIAIFSNKSFLNGLGNSIGIAAVASLLAMILSVVVASATVTLSSPARLMQVSGKLPVLSSSILARVLARMISISAMLYLVFPALVMGLGFFLLYQRFGGNPVIWAACVVTLANALFAIPFTVAVLRPAIQGAAKKHDRLCASLGLGRWTRWRHIDWPTLKSDVTYAAALAFCFSLGDLGVIALFGSEEFRTLPWLLYQNFGAYRTQEASAIALILLILVIGVFWIAQLSASSSAKEHSA